jgi:ABC-type transport system substrate-binding protein
MQRWESAISAWLAWLRQVAQQNKVDIATGPEELTDGLIHSRLDWIPCYSITLDTLQKADAEYDGKKRHELFGQAQRLMHESAWFGYMWFENGNFLVNNRVKGFPATWGSFREWEWFIN